MELSKKDLNKLHAYVQRKFTWDSEHPYTTAGYGFFLVSRDRNIVVSMCKGTRSKCTFLSITRRGEVLFERHAESFEDVRIFKAIVLGVG